MSNFELLQQELVKSYCDRSWLRLAGISREDIRNFAVTQMTRMIYEAIK